MLGFIGIAGLLSLVIWGTVRVGSAVVDKKTMAMEGIKNTLIGIGIALTAYIMLYTINPDLTIIKVPEAAPLDVTSQTNTCYNYSASACPTSSGCELASSSTGEYYCMKKGDSVNGCCLWEQFTGDFAGNYKNCVEEAATGEKATYASCAAAPYKGVFYPGRKCAEKKLYKDNWVLDTNAVGKYCAFK